MLSFKPTFSLSTFTFIERLLSSSSHSAIRACFYSVALSQPLKSQPLRPLVLHCSPLTPKTSYFQGSPGRTGPLVTQFVPFTPRGQGFQEGGSGARARCTEGSVRNTPRAVRAARGPSSHQASLPSPVPSARCLPHAKWPSLRNLFSSPLARMAQRPPSPSDKPAHIRTVNKDKIHLASFPPGSRTSCKAKGMDGQQCS